MFLIRLGSSQLHPSALLPWTHNSTNLSHIHVLDLVPVSKSKKRSSMTQNLYNTRHIANVTYMNHHPSNYGTMLPSRHYKHTKPPARVNARESERWMCFTGWSTIWDEGEHPGIRSLNIWNDLSSFWFQGEDPTIRTLNVLHLLIIYLSPMRTPDNHKFEHMGMVCQASDFKANTKANSQ